MTEQPQTPESEQPGEADASAWKSSPVAGPSEGADVPFPGVSPEPVPAAEPAPLPPASDGFAVAATTAERPEIPVAAAFAGGLALALILRRLAR